MMQQAEIVNGRPGTSQGVIKVSGKLSFDVKDLQVAGLNNNGLIRTDKDSELNITAHSIWLESNAKQDYIGDNYSAIAAWGKVNINAEDTFVATVNGQYRPSITSNLSDGGILNILSDGSLSINAQNIHIFAGKLTDPDSGSNADLTSMNGLYSAGTINLGSADKKLKTLAIYNVGNGIRIDNLNPDHHSLINTENLYINTQINDKLGNALITSNTDVSADNATILGNLYVEEGDNNFNFGSDSYFEGTTDYSDFGFGDYAKLSLSLGQNSTWKMTNHSYISNTFAPISSTIDMSEIADISSSKLDIHSYAGDNSTFVLKTDLKNTASSLINIGTVEGSGRLAYVAIKDTSGTDLSNTDFADTLFAQVGGNTEDLSFTVQETLSNSGLTIFSGKTTAVEKNGITNWYLTQVQAEPGYTPLGVLDGLKNNYFIWRSLTESTRERFGDLRRGEDPGLWIRIGGGSLSGEGFDSDYQTYRIGYDLALIPQFKLGLMLEQTEADVDSHYGSGDMSMTAAAVYGLFSYNTYYLDTGVRIGYMDYDYTNNYILKDTFDFKGSNVSAWIEGGKECFLNKAWLLVPHIALSYGRSDSEDFTTANGINASTDSLNSWIGTIGTDLEYRSEYFSIAATADVMRELSGEQDVNLSDNSGNYLKESWDYKDTWFEYGLSGAVNYKSFSSWISIKRSAGSEIDNEWRAVFGLRYGF